MNCSIAILFAIIFIIVYIPSTYAQDNLSTYEKSTIGLKLNYSENESAVTDNCNNPKSCLIIFNNNNDKSTSFTIYAQSGSEFKDKCDCDSLLEFVQNDYKNTYNNLQNTIINDSQTILADNIPSLQMEYSTKKENKKSFHIITWTKHNDIYYRFSYHSSDEFDNVLQKNNQLLQSVKFFPPYHITPLKKIDEVSIKKQPSFMVKKQPSFMENSSEASSDLSTYESQPEETENKFLVMNRDASDNTTLFLNLVEEIQERINMNRDASDNTTLFLGNITEPPYDYTNVDELSNYYDPNSDTSIDYPYTWRVEKNNEYSSSSGLPAYSFFSDNKSGRAFLYVIGSDNDLSINSLSQLLDFRLSMNDDVFNIKSSITAKLSGFPAYEFEFEFVSEMDGNTHYIVERGAIIDNKIYSLRGGYENNEQNFDNSIFSKIFDSFTIHSTPEYTENSRSYEQKFLWGAASSSYQFEGGINNNDWDFFTRNDQIRERIWYATSIPEIYGNHPVNLQPANDGVRFWDPRYYEQDFENAKDIGFNSMRIGIEWSRIEPKNDQWNNDAISHYKKMITSMKEKGLTPIITLNHYTLPLWVLTPPSTVHLNIVPSSDPFFKSLRGWENEKTVAEYIEYVKKVVSEFKDEVDYWITFNEPVGAYIGAGYIAGMWPPGFLLDGERAKKVLYNLIQAHTITYDVISNIDNSDADGDGVSKSVGLAHAMIYVKPSTIGIFNNVEAAKNFEYFVNDYFLNAVVHGIEDINYLSTVQRYNTNNYDFNIHKEWQNKIDFIGINYYRSMHVSFDPIVSLSSAKFIGGKPLNNLNFFSQPHGKLNDLGWEIYPEGLYKLIMSTQSKWKKPIMITENGIPDKSDKKRAPYIVAHINQVKKAIDDGANVIGYMYWALTDNYEWLDNYSQNSQFGLYRIDRNNYDLQRVETDGVSVFKQIIKDSDYGQITDSSVSNAKKTYGIYSDDGRTLIK